MKHLKFVQKVFCVFASTNASTPAVAPVPQSHANFSTAGLEPSACAYRCRKLQIIELESRSRIESDSKIGIQSRSGGNSKRDRRSRGRPEADAAGEDRSI
ncbi:hypothetical protein EVAR_54235_1 [Eumeta japonica]|uniref:Uncharacterized protein n=1 Tax=Eumeta variegata TaxID=151549 RepID=A0A4C1YZV6_EUMVA|nr:hypothetical protein EVAR_54235_1 [Eumeta japonica]